MVKTNFSKRISPIEIRSKVRIRRGERGIPQRRFLKHAVRDDKDFEADIDYINFNPVKYGLVSRVTDWPYSTFHRYVENGLVSFDYAEGYDIEMDVGERKYKLAKGHVVIGGWRCAFPPYMVFIVFSSLLAMESG